MAAPAAEPQARWADERKSVTPEEIYRLFKIAAGEAALCELKLRLLADKVPELESLALDQKLENIERRLTKVFAHCLSTEDCLLLERSRRLRNKLLHADFFEARSRLAQLGAPQRSGGVVRIQLDLVPGASMLEKIEMIATRTVGTPVAATSSTQDGSILGWLIELATSGDLLEATAIFEGSVSPLLDRLAAEADKLDVKLNE